MMNPEMNHWFQILTIFTAIPATSLQLYLINFIKSYHIFNLGSFNVKLGELENVSFCVHNRVRLSATRVGNGNRHGWPVFV